VALIKCDSFIVFPFVSLKLDTRVSITNASIRQQDQIFLFRFW
jgi:hypothetical protein